MCFVFVNCGMSVCSGFVHFVFLCMLLFVCLFCVPLFVVVCVWFCVFVWPFSCLSLRVIFVVDFWAFISCRCVCFVWFVYVCCVCLLMVYSVVCLVWLLSVLFCGCRCFVVALFSAIFDAVCFCCALYVYCVLFVFGYLCLFVMFYVGFDCLDLFCWICVFLFLCLVLCLIHVCVVDIVVCVC